MVKIKSIFDLSAFKSFLENTSNIKISDKTLSTAKKISYDKKKK